MVSAYPALKNERCKIYDPHGRLIWVSPAWGNDYKTCFGFGYLEFIHYDDTEDFVQWVRTPGATTITFRTVSPKCGTEVTARYEKVAFDGNWLVVGEHISGWDNYGRIKSVAFTLALGGLGWALLLPLCLVAAWWRCPEKPELVATRPHCRFFLQRNNDSAPFSAFW